MIHDIKSKGMGLVHSVCAITLLVVVALFASSALTLAKDEGLVAHWSFDEGKGQVITDKVWENHGRLGSTEDVDDNDPEWVVGISGKALLFTTEKQTYVEVPSSPAIKPVDAITVMAWIKTTTRSGNHHIVSNKWDSDIYGYRLYQSWSAILFEFGDGKSFHLIGGGSLIIDTWHHVAATFDGRAIKVYFDGEEVGSKELNEVVHIEYTWRPIIIGNYVGSKSAYPFDGVIDEVRILNRALSKEEIVTYMKRDLSALAFVLSL